MSFNNITTRRLILQKIAGSVPITPQKIVQYMGAMQAQDYYGVLWAVGLRTGKTEREVIQAIQERKLIRTWPQRGTLHLIPAEDAKWVVGLSADRVLKSAKRRRAELGLDDKTLALCKTILRDTLAGDRLVARPQIMEALERAGISTESGRGYHILWHLSLMGVTYVGPMQLKQPTFGLLDDLTTPTQTLSHEESIVELVRRYFSSHGPATRDDFMWWSGLTAADVKFGLEANKDLICSERGESKEYWMPRDGEDSSTADAAFLLPGFDEYMLGYKDRSAALHADHAHRIVPGGNGMFLSTVVIHGQVVGTWKRSIQKKQVQIKITPFQKLTKTDLKLLDEPAEHYGRFVSLPPQVEIE